MTGPVERVPLTDDKLDELEKFARDNGNILALGFIAELRASRAREQAQRTLREHAEHVKVELRAERDGLQQRMPRGAARRQCRAAASNWLTCLRGTPSPSTHSW